MSWSIDDGPSSKKSPVSDEQPGPPLSQRTTGSFLGSFRDSKNPRLQLAHPSDHQDLLDSQ